MDLLYVVWRGAGIFSSQAALRLHCKTTPGHTDGTSELQTLTLQEEAAEALTLVAEVALETRTPDFPPV